MKKNLNLFIVFFGLVLAFASCKGYDDDVQLDKEPNLPTSSFDYSLNIPDHIGASAFLVDPAFSNSFIGGSPLNEENPDITNAGATLGRVLFYDSRLSKNSTVSCSSCHFQERGFTDNKAFSVGFEGAITPRNSMAIINPALNRNLFWDTRSNSALNLTLQPIQNHIEMGMDNIDALVSKINDVEFYQPLFQEAFGQSAASAENISSALAQFLCSMTTFDTKFDEGQSTNFANFTALENLGHELFMSERTSCNTCHAAPMFAAQDSPGGPYGAPEVKGTANNGLDLVYDDEGRGDGLFKITSLRNIELTAPYMHDGRFETLEEVIEHYNSGIKDHQKLDINLKEGGQPKQMNLSTLEKKAMVAFLKTLTDRTFTADPKYSDPFN